MLEMKTYGIGRNYNTFWEIQKPVGYCFCLLSGKDNLFLPGSNIGFYLYESALFILFFSWEIKMEIATEKIKNNKFYYTIWYDRTFPKSK